MMNAMKTNRLTALVLPLLVGSLVITACGGQKTAQEPAAPTTAPAPQSTDKVANPLNAGLEGTNRPGTDPLELMQNPQVKAELGLTDAQVTEIKTIAEDFRVNLKQDFSDVDWKSMDPKERDAKFTEVTNKTKDQIQVTRDKVGKVFKPEQLKRFKEITLQLYGFGALSFDSFTEDLKLTSDQQKQLNDIRDQLGKKVRANLVVPDINDPEAVKKAVADNRKRTEQIFQASNQQALAVLTPEQQKSLEQLRGKEFKFEQTPPS